MNKLKGSKDKPLVLGGEMSEEAKDQLLPHVKLPFAADNFQASKMDKRLIIEPTLVVSKESVESEVSVRPESEGEPKRKVGRPKKR